MTRITETVMFACGHKETYTRNGAIRQGPEIGDVWSCPICSSARKEGKNKGLTEVTGVARSYSK